MPNRLAREASPYLLQHADNPVDWFAWGEDAFARARDGDRPIFLSIGYSTCHWCHVMEHESFENAEVAAVLNRDFVSIKVDREERPDVDRVYMTFVQASTGAGGWPMSVWLTPDLKPFYGGTYFPPSSRWGRPGFIEILQEIARLWRTERERVVGSAEAAIERLRAMGETGAAGPVAGVDALTDAVEQYRATFDARHGGFGGAPKFPRPSELLFLFREYARTGSGTARDMALDTLTAMALGGMRDHIGGGFHRYSVDAEWRVPHFEKMLYDQAQLTLAYLEAAQVTGRGFYADVAEDTLQYVRREMTSPEGGFYSAEDADSVPPEHANQAGAHKSEGAYYLWTDSELDDLLGTDAPMFKARFGIRPDGNAPQDPLGEFVGKNLLYTEQPVEDVAARLKTSREAVEAALGRARLVLYEARSQRPKPHRDDKVLTAWNGLMIAAFSRGARVLGADAPEKGEAHLQTAIGAATFIRTKMIDSEGRLLRRYRAGQSAIRGYAEDHAFLIFGLLELFQATGDLEWLEWARALQDEQDRLFWDSQGGGWFSTTEEDRSVLLRVKEEHDGAEPSATSLATMNALCLGYVTGNQAYIERATTSLQRFGPRLGQYARVVPMLMAALATYHAGFDQVVLVGPGDREDTLALRRMVATRYLPFTLIIPVDLSARREVKGVMPALSSMRMIDDKATAYFCRDFVCREPTTSAEALEAQLERRASVSS